jgi:hypothetical protein
MSEKTQVTCATVTSGEGRGRASRLVRGVFAKPARSLTTLAIAASVAGVSQAVTAAPGDLEANRIFAKCTFTTADLQKALKGIPTGNLQAFQASYILIYVRQNPNDGQQIKGTSTFSGPFLCINAGSESIAPTTETTAIGTTNAPVDLLGTEEAFHLQYRLNPPGGDIQKRVCHTVGTNTDCFIVGKKP